MICAKCLSQIDASSHPCTACGEHPLLEGRYRIDRPLPPERGPAQRSYRVTQVEDAMLFRACAIKLGPGEAHPRSGAELARALVPRLLELDSPVLAQVVEHSLDEHNQISWLIYEHISGTSVAELIAEVDSRLTKPRWLAALMSSLAELIAELHAEGLTGIDFAPELIGLRGRSSARAKAGPPRACMLELGLSELRGAAPRSTDDDIRELGLSFIQMLDAESGGKRESALELVRAGSWRELAGLDSGLQLLLEQMLSDDPSLRLDSEELRTEAQRLGASLRETRRQPTPLRIVKTPPAAMRAAPPPRLEPKRAGPRPMPLSRESVRAHRPAGDDIPVMRPEDLSRELSQAQRATATFPPPARKPLGTLVAIVVVVAALATLALTYLALLR